MKIRFRIGKKIKSLTFLLICLLVFFFKINTQILNALPMENYQDEIVIEELRLRVPAHLKATWLNAEKEIWDPWLSSQDGFLGRQLFWDKEKEEALILVTWKSKNLWTELSIFYRCWSSGTSSIDESVRRN